VDALFEGLRAEYYVNGSATCAWNFQRAEKNLAYMSNYLSIDQHKYPNHTDQLEATIANITLSVGPYVPWAFYFCYALPEKTENIWIQHYNEFVNFKDFEYAFMQNLLGNILSFMDVYEKSA
jgi:hypothetical protein